MSDYKFAEMDIIGGTDDGIRVRYDYDAGEDQYFDARAGVGSPGYPPSVTITEVCIDGQWRTLDELAWLDIDACEKQVMMKIELEARDERD